jgi:NAD(P)-dependent dehydrogenase (short-subunit alcohol dehydrogenase family)
MTAGPPRAGAGDGRCGRPLRDHRRARVLALGNARDHEADVALATTPEDLQRQIEFQLYGAIAATSAVVPAMQEAGTGTLLYTTRAGSIDPITMLGNVNSAAAALRNRDPRARVGTACPRAAPPPG